MANPNPKPRQPEKDIAPRIRKAFIRAVKGKGGIDWLADKVADSLETDFIPTLNALSKFSIREKQVNHDHKGVIAHVQADLLGDWLNGFTAAECLSDDSQGFTGVDCQGSHGQDALLVQERPLLPTQVCFEPEGRRESLVIQEDTGSTSEPER